MSSSERPAKLRYEPNGFKIIGAGKYVLCAASGERIGLEALRYWSVERQEAYASAEMAAKILLPA